MARLITLGRRENPCGPVNELAFTVAGAGAAGGMQKEARVTLTIDPANTAVLIMDFQEDVISHFIPVDPALLDRAAAVLDRARAAEIPVIYVVVQFRAGYPEVPPTGLFSMVRSMGRLVEGSAGAGIHASVAPRAGDIVVTKRRVSAFSGSDLDYVLRAAERRHLVLFGIATSGVVLSTVRAAADLDYELHVIGDCCADRDEEVHHVLLDKVFVTMAPTITAAQFIGALTA